VKTAKKRPRSTAYRHVKDAERYVAAVLSWKIPACKWVKLACQRHKRDMKSAENKEFRYVFDPEKAERACKFMEYLPHVKGKWAKPDPITRLPQAMKLEPWQKFIVCSIFGWVHKKTGKRRFHKARLYVPRKNGKSFFGAGIGLYMLAMDKEAGAEVYSGATSEKQAWEVFGPARQMTLAHPRLAPGLGITVNAQSLVCEKDNSKFLPVIGKPGDGSSPHCAIIDEYHEHKTSELIDTMETGMGAREQPLSLVISTAGADISGPCREDWKACERILENTGGFEDDTTFCIIFTVDSSETKQLSHLSLHFELIHDNCSCNFANYTKIKKLVLETCAEHVTKNTGNPKTKKSASIIQKNTLDAETCVGLATKKSLETKTLTENQHTIEKLKSGETETKKASNPLRPNTEASQKIEQHLRTSADTKNTELRHSVIRSFAKSNMESVQFAGNQQKFYAWIIAMIQNELGGFCADSATVQSVYLEILRNLLKEHTSICETRKKYIEEQGNIFLYAPPDQWDTEAALIKANPNWGVSINAERILAELKVAQQSARKQSAFKTKYLNQWVTAKDGFFNVSEWEKAKADIKREDYKDFPCYIACDLSVKHDLTAVMQLFCLPDKRYAVFGRYYLPEETISLPQNQHYRTWQIGGWIEASGERVIDYDDMKAHVMDLCKNYKVAEIPCDPWNGWQVLKELSQEGAPIIEFGLTTKTMNEPMKTLDALIRSGRIIHDGDPVLAWAMGNVTAKEDANGNVFPRKESPDNKIDPVVAAIMAMGRAIVRPDTPTGPLFAW
jgi:phage terminase large subunit-like protein